MHQRYRERKLKGKVRLEKPGNSEPKMHSKVYDGVTGEEQVYEHNDSIDVQALEARQKALEEEIEDIKELIKDIERLEEV